MAEHKIILASVAPGSEGAVTASLAEVLGLSEDGAKPFVGSAPIILVDGLESDQAQAIASAMAAVKQAGGNLVISAAPGQNMPHVDWPAPPKVRGREIASFAAAEAGPPKAPAGAKPRSGVRQAVAERAAPPVSPRQAAATAHTTSVSAATITCPHCGKPIAIHASPAGPGAAPRERRGIRQVPVSDVLGAAAPEGAETVGKALPEVPNVQGHVESPPPAAGVPTSPMDLEEFERGVGGGGSPPQSSDTLLKQLDKALVPPPSPQPRPPSPVPRPKAKVKPKKPPTAGPGRGARVRPQSPRGAADRVRGRGRKRPR